MRLLGMLSSVIIFAQIPAAHLFFKGLADRQRCARLCQELHFRPMIGTDPSPSPPPPKKKRKEKLGLLASN